jgi:hypothetical protein
MLRPKARGPHWFGDPLRSRLSSLSWHRLHPRSSLWRERLLWLFSTLSGRGRTSMVFRVSRLGPRRLLTADAAAPTPSPRPCCCEGGGFELWADGTPARPRSERWREAELSACCVAAASSNAFNCWRIRHSSEVAGSGQPRSSLAAAARFWDAHRKRGGASASAFTPPLARRLLSGSGTCAGGVGARPRGWSTAE